MTSFFVTGTAGFVGFHTARRLLADGHKVAGYDGMTPYYDVGLKRRRHAILVASPAFTPVEAMLEDADALRRAAGAAEPDVVIHLAAQAGVRYSLEQPRAYVDANIVGSWNVLDVARSLGVRHLLLASTSSVYGANDKMPFAETDPTDRPISIYAATKKAMEVMAHSHAHLHDVPTTAFRFFTVYGPWGRPDMALFKFVDAIINDRPIDVYGAGKMRRDFTYIDDLVEAIVRLVDLPPAAAAGTSDAAAPDTPAASAPFRVVNIGGGLPVGLMDFIRSVEKALGKAALLNLLPMQPGDMRDTFADATLLEELTGYRPATTLDEGVRAFVAWYRGQVASPPGAMASV